MRALDLDQLQHLAGGFTNRERFLTELTQDSPEASSDESGKPLRDEDDLILSTLHSAKCQGRPPPPLRRPYPLHS